MSKPTIVQGEDITLSFQVKTETGAPFNLTGHTVEAHFEGSSACVEVSGTLSATPADGTFSVTLTNTNTEALKVGTISCEALLDDGAHPAGDRRIVQFKNSIVVVERICS